MLRRVLRSWRLRRGRPGLEVDPWRHGPPLLLCTALWAVTHLWRQRRPPMSLVIREREHDGADRVNAVDLFVRERARWRDPLLARRLSNALAHLVIPVAAWALVVRAGRGARGGPLADLLALNAAVVYAGAASQAVKLGLRRQRPFARFAQRPTSGTRQPDDDNLSFFSSHTSTSFAAAIAVGAIARRRAAPIPVLPLAACAAATGYLRIASDRHYLSDVLAGAATGALFGALTPRLLHRR